MVVLLVIVLVLSATYHMNTSQIAFDAAVWRSNDHPVQFTGRYRMKDDLMRQLLQWEPDAAKVLAVLGTPSHSNYGSTSTEGEALFMRYPLGYARSYVLLRSQYYLLINFSPTGQLQSVSVHPD